MSRADWPGNEAELKAQLARRRERYEQLVYGMSDLLVLTDPDGTVAFSNRAGGASGRTRGYPDVGENLLDAVVEADRSKVAGALEDVLGGGAASRRVLFRVGVGEGGPRTVEGAFTPVTEDGRVVRAEFLGRDVTDRQRSAEALRRSNRALRRRQAELDRDLEVAATIQDSLLPAPLETEHVLIDLKHLPLLSVGGDYVHIDSRDPLRPGVIVFDVAGHGISSALVANRVHSGIYALLDQDVAPAEMVRRLNAFVYESFSDLGLFVTLLALRLDLPAGSGLYCGAGHPPALLRRGETGRMETLNSQHLPIGVEADAFMGERESRVDVAPGDLIWLYTDGLMELRCRENRMLGVEGLMDRLGGIDASEARPGMVEAALRRILGQRERPCDDITLVGAAVRKRP